MSGKNKGGKMTNYTYNNYEQSKINPSGNGRAEWVTVKENFKNAKRTSENLELATSKETMKFFRNMGSKQQIKRSYKNGKEVIKIFSYAPNNLNYRSVHEFIEQ